MISDDDLTLAKLYFEEMIDCVAGCGCWESGWDSRELVHEFAREGFEWRADTTPAAVLDALHRLQVLAPAQLADASRYLGLHFDSVDDFREFWAPSVRALEDFLP